MDTLHTALTMLTEAIVAYTRVQNGVTEGLAWQASSSREENLGTKHPPSLGYPPQRSRILSRLPKDTKTLKATQRKREQKHVEAT